MNCKIYKAYTETRRKFLELTEKNVKSEVDANYKSYDKDFAGDNVKKHD